MVNFQSECLCLMVTMFSLNRAALLQLLVMCQVFAGTVEICVCSVCFFLFLIIFNIDWFSLWYYNISLILIDWLFPSLLGHCLVHHWDILVSRGESVTLTCNTSEEKITQVHWTNDRFSFIHSILLNKTFSNLTSHRLTIDGNLSLNLNVFNATHEDAGLYTCTVSGDRGTWTTEWNMTVSEAPEGKHRTNDTGVSSSWDFLYLLIYVIGLLLCVIATAVCLCRWVFI